MSEIHAELPNESFPTPSGIVTATVCSQSGKLPVPGLCDGSKKNEYFAEGTVPTTSCNVHYAGAVCSYSALTGALPASPECPFKVSGVLTLNPDTLTPPAEGTTTEGTPSPDTAEDPASLAAQQTPTVTCPHNAMFFATPGYEIVLEQQRLEMAMAGIVLPQDPAADPAADPAVPQE